jgi:Kef-type K+ transport system membrane component KefB
MLTSVHGIDQTTLDLTLIAAVAVLAPVLSDVLPRVRLPVAVLEIALGIVVGPQVLGLVHPDVVVAALSDIGLAFLFFLAGFEIDPDRIKGRPLELAAAGWLLSVVLGLALGTALHAAGLVGSGLYVGMAMSTTAIGTLMPILRDAGVLSSRLGPLVLAAGAVGEFGPIALSAIVFDRERGVVGAALVLNLFAVVVLAGVVVARRWQPVRLGRLIRQTMHSSGQVAVRLSMLLIVAGVAVATVFGLDFLLGAFAAGLVAAEAARTAGAEGREQAELLRVKYEGIGFGFIIPIFFIVTGVRFDLHALLASPVSLALVPLFLVLFLVVRGAPVPLLYRRDADRPDLVRLVLLSATQLPLVVAITDLGVAAGELTTATAASLVGAAMASVFLLPAVALARSAPAYESPLPPPSSKPPPPPQSFEESSC